MSGAAEAGHLLEQIERGALGGDPRDHLRRAIGVADEAGDDDVGYRARMLMTDAAHWHGDADAMLTAFAWCVARHDSDPARFPITAGGDGPDLLFQHKWIAGLLAGNSRFPLARISAVLDDMQRRFREAGLSQNGVLQARRDVAVDLGDLEAAARYASERDLTPRDDYSHCEACVRSTDAGFAAMRGDDATAIRLWEEIRDQGLTCGEEPECADSQILLALVRAGRGAEALDVHASSYRFARTNPDAMSLVRFHLEFLAVTGNVERGLDLLERHLPGFAVDRFSDQRHMAALRSIGVLLDAAADDGLGDREVRGTDGENIARLLGEETRVMTIAEFRERAWSETERLAAALDARNGNGHSADRMAAARALRGERRHLPFSTGAPFSPAVPERPAPADPSGWLREARRLLAGGHLQRAREAALQGLDGASPDVLPLLRSTLVQTALAEGDREEAMAQHRLRVRALHDAGRDEHAQVERRLGLALLGGTDRADADRIEEEIDRARPMGASPSVLAELLIAHASILLDFPGLGDADVDLAVVEAREAALVLREDDPELLWPSLVDTHLAALTHAELFEEAAQVAAGAVDDPRAEGTPLLLARRILTVSLASKARFAEAAEAADGLVADAMRVENPLHVGNAAMLAAQIYGDLGRPREAAARAAFGVRSLERVDAAYPGHRHTLASLQLDAGQPQQALESFQLTLDQLQERDDVEPSVLARVTSGMGAAAAQCGELGIAYRVWAWAARVAEEAELWDQAAGATLDAADLLHRVGDEDALATAEQAVELAHRSLTPILIARGLQLVGWLRCLGGDETGLASLDESVRVAESAGLDEQAADARISSARALEALGRADDAVAALREAAERAGAKGIDRFAHVARLHLADVLASSGREAEGVMACRALIDAIDPQVDPDLLEAARDALARLGG